MKTALVKMGLWAAGWIVAGGLVSQVEPFRYEGSRSRDEQGREQRNHSALAVMLGEFRTSASDLMFIQTERYLHGGISFRKGTSHAMEEDHDEHEHDLMDEHEHDEEHDPANPRPDALEHGEPRSHGSGHPRIMLSNRSRL